MLAILNLKFASFFENEEKDSIFYRALCQGIGETVKVMIQERTFFYSVCTITQAKQTTFLSIIQKIDRNWQHGPESKYQVSHFSQPELESIFWIPGSFVFELNQKWIGRSQHDGCIALWNRWTWEFYKVSKDAYLIMHN